MINKKTFQISFLTVLLGCSSCALAADPVSAVLGLLFMEKVSTPAHQHKAPPPHRWRDFLSPPQRAVLKRMEEYTAIGACVAKADANDPIAAYQVRKIAQFGSNLERAIGRDGRTPDITRMRYRRPAKAYRWCVAHSGGTARRASLAQDAHRLARMVRGVEPQRSLLASAHE
ncbi:MAG: hypothetical protein P8076_13525 [Gammaproteobacteria bacterium]